MSKNIVKVILMMTVLAMVGAFAYAEDDSLPTDSFFTKNINLNSIVYTTQGVVVVYNTGRKYKEAYLPNKFFQDGRVKMVPTTESGMNLQANVFYRNGKPYKVKIYTNKNAQGPGYVVRENVTKTMKDKFDSTEELDFVIR
ncbi:MAG: hypothetical protein II707_04845 [Spirochaetales bacterium]|nr:hypothetical protein [Spirochaetales bacterium]